MQFFGCNQGFRPVAYYRLDTAEDKLAYKMKDDGAKKERVNIYKTSQNLKDIRKNLKEHYQSMAKKMNQNQPQNPQSQVQENQDDNDKIERELVFLQKIFQLYGQEVAQGDEQKGNKQDANPAGQGQDKQLQPLSEEEREALQKKLK